MAEKKKKAPKAPGQNPYAYMLDPQWVGPATPEMAMNKAAWGVFDKYGDSLREQEIISSILWGQ